MHSARINRLLSDRIDLVIGVLVVFVLVMLVVPLPTAVLDSAIALNLSVSILVLLTAFFLPDATRLPSFPTIILLTTLFRLALNVSSTRLILLQADAGQIIHTFGEFAVGGNMIVGAVVFLVLTVVQFIVISKGSERVAEVSARFTLDAMQGRQLAIDAAVQRGDLSAGASRRMRDALDRENKLYGAMDGAMKFVKGDAIASVIISLINVLAGLAIGILQQGMAAGEALRTYTLLTVGDGLVSQIPSLLLCVAAGLVVTRVSADGASGRSNAATDIVRQIGAQPRAVLAASLLMLGVAVTSGFTGFPWWPFTFLGVGLGTVAAIGLRRDAMTEGPHQQDARDDDDELPADCPWANLERLVVAVGPDLYAALAVDRSDAAIHRLLGEAVTRCAQRRGVPIPEPRIRLDARFADGYAILVHSRLCARVRLRSDERIALCDIASAITAGAAQVDEHRVRWRRGVAVRVCAASAARLSQHGVETIDVASAIADHLEAQLEINIDAFLSIHDVSNLMAALKVTHPELVNLVCSGLNPHLLQVVAEVLVCLTQSHVPLTDLPFVIETYARQVRLGESSGSRPDQIAESMRPQLRHQIGSAVQYERGVVRVIEISPPTTLQTSPDDPTVSIYGERLAASIREAIAQRDLDPTQVAIRVHPAELRRDVERLLRDCMPFTPVIAIGELPHDVIWEPIKTVAVAPVIQEAA